jgi:hypothetical protein
MRLSRPVKVVVGVATLWPALWLMAEAVCMVTGLSNVHEGGPVEIAVCDAIWAMRWSLFLLPLLMVFYLAYLFRKPGLTGTEKGMWAAAILVGCAPLFMPLFFLLQVWRDGGPSDRPA